MKSDYKKLAILIVIMALGTALSPFTSFPIGIAKVNPTQHFINVFLAVQLGTWWSVGAATGMAVIRNALGVGTLLAFPGGMIGALFAGLAYKVSKNIFLAAAGEILGTGVVAPLVSSLLIAPYLMGKEIGFLALLPSFILSSVAGSVLAIIVFFSLRTAGVLPKEPDATA